MEMSRYLPLCREDVLNQKKNADADANEAFEVPSIHLPHLTGPQYYMVTFDYTEKLRNVLIGLRKRIV